MTVLFVHGVPDTARLWAPVLEHLPENDRRVLSMPGFGAPVPAGFTCSMDAYAAWLVAEIDAAGGAVDLVGHDWGGLLVQRAASLRPGQVRSWAAGGVAIDETYVWHDTARVWQTPGEGEAFMEAMGGELMAAALTQWRVPQAHAETMAAHADAVMKDAILKLYRSAVDIGTDWGPELDQLPSRGLVLWGDQDPFAAPAVGLRLSERSGARFHLFEDCGHWWPYERPRETAEALLTLWSEA